MTPQNCWRQDGPKATNKTKKIPQVRKGPTKPPKTTQQNKIKQVASTKSALSTPARSSPNSFESLTRKEVQRQGSRAHSGVATVTNVEVHKAPTRSTCVQEAKNTLQKAVTSAKHPPLTNTKIVPSGNGNKKVGTRNPVIGIIPDAANDAEVNLSNGNKNDRWSN